MSLENNATAFRTWLTETGKVTEASAGSYVDYCERVERDLPTVLDKYLTTDAGLESVLMQIEIAIPNERSRGNLKTAARKYAAFLQGEWSAARNFTRHMSGTRETPADVTGASSSVGSGSGYAAERSS